MAAIPCTISTPPPPPSNNPAPGIVSGSNKTQSTSSVVYTTTCSPGSGAPGSESLVEGQTKKDVELFEQFMAFRKAHDSLSFFGG